MAKCRYCDGTRKIPLLVTTVDCDCVKQCKTSVENSSGPQDFVAFPHPEFMNGWHSPTYAKNHGQVVYLHSTTGKEVTITEISIRPTPHLTLPDTVFVGVINKRRLIRGGIHLAKSWFQKEWCKNGMEHNMSVYVLRWKNGSFTYVEGDKLTTSLMGRPIEELKDRDEVVL